MSSVLLERQPKDLSPGRWNHWMLTLRKLKDIKMLIWNEQPRRVIAKEMGDESKTAVTNLIDRAVD